MIRLALVLVWFDCIHISIAFQPSAMQNGFQLMRPTKTFTSLASQRTLNEVVNFEDLTVMDVVLFRRLTEEESKLELGAVQETRTVAPLSAWTTESSYTSSVNDMMEFVVDEEDMFPGLTSDDIQVLTVFDGSVIGYGSRQVGGGKGPGNPHGEESELLYYIDRSVVEGIYNVDIDGEESKLREMKVELVVNPSLEHLW
jgi:hypothetical protein